MNYQLHYDRLIQRARDRQLAKGVYSERHHIVPKCLGGSNDTSNLVRLTAEEHFVAHLLLIKIHPGNALVAFAIQAMTMKNKNLKKRIGNKLYGWARRAFAKAVSETMTGRPVSEENKKKNSVLMTERMLTEKNPMRNEEFKAAHKIVMKSRFSGDNNPARRTDVREKMCCKRPCMQGDGNPMRRQGAGERFAGENSAMRRPEVAAKVSSWQRSWHDEKREWAESTGFKGNYRFITKVMVRGEDKC